MLLLIQQFLKVWYKGDPQDWTKYEGLRYFVPSVAQAQELSSSFQVSEN